MFTYRDFEGGTLGLAWTGDLKNAGGVCEKNGVRKINEWMKKKLNIVFVHRCGGRGWHLIPIAILDFIESICLFLSLNMKN